MLSKRLDDLHILFLNVFFRGNVEFVHIYEYFYMHHFIAYGLKE